MKKILVTALMLALILSLAACGSAQPEVTIVPTDAPAATAAPTVEPAVEPTAEPTPLPENPETEEQILNNFLEDFTRAYFYGTAEDVQPYLSADFQCPVEAYQGGEPSAIETRLHPVRCRGRGQLYLPFHRPGEHGCGLESGLLRAGKVMQSDCKSI